MAPLGAKGWFRVRMCQIASASRRARSTWATLARWISRGEGLSPTHSASPTRLFEAGSESGRALVRGLPDP